MNGSNDLQDKQDVFDTENNRRYVMKDVVGKRHVFIAGEQGMTEEWIAFLRHDENVVHSSDYHYYFRWNGKEYVPSVIRTDILSPDDLEHFPSMLAPDKDGEASLIEKEDREAFLQKFHSAMDSLTDNQRDLIWKRCELGLSDVEIAQQEGVSPAAIFHRWERIKHKLNNYLNR